MPRFLQITTASGPYRPPTPEHIAIMQKSIGERIASGNMLATGGIGKRATSAARLVSKDGKITLEDPPAGEGWMASGGYALTTYASKEEAIADARKTLEVMGNGMMELIQVSEMFPPPGHVVGVTNATALPPGVIPYLSFDGASEAIDFYKKAFGATEVARMLAQDGKKIMHCQLEINSGAFMLADNFPEFGMGAVQRNASYVMQLVLADGDPWWERAIKAGCKERMPFAVAPWGDKYGQMADPFGVTWAFNTPAKK